MNTTHPLHRDSPTIPAWRWALRALLVGLMSVAALAQPASTQEGTADTPEADATQDGQATETTQSSPAAPATNVVPASRQADNVAILTIRGMITAVTTASMERRIDEAVNAGADAIVVDIDTPGGQVPAVLNICTQLKRAPVPTYGWVNPDAYSGGAFIALACDEIIISPAATMGDAAPIVPGRELSPTERQKALAPLLAELVESARMHGYDEKLVQAFVVLGVELWYIEDTKTGVRHFINEPEYRALFGEEPPRVSPHMASGVAGADASSDPSESDRTGEGSDLFPTEGTSDAPPPQGERGGVLNRGAEGSDAEFEPASDQITDETVETINQTIAEQSARPDFSKADPERYRLIHYATDGSALLTLSESDLKRYGFAESTINNDEELKKYFGATNLARLDQTWSETMVGFMTQGFSGLAVRGVLIVFFLLGMFIEMSMPGVGLPGGVAVLALLGLIVPPMLIGAASWWTAVVILLGVGLIVTEIFVFPGFGVPGVAGLILMLTGFVGTFAQAGEIFPGGATGDYARTLYALSITGVALFIALVGMFLFSKYTHRFPVVGGLVLADGGSGRSGGGGSVGFLEAMGNEDASPSGVRVGDVGETINTLRPSGTARFGDDLVDVVAKLGYIDSGAPVRVAQVTDFRVIVVPVREEEGGPTVTGEGPDHAGDDGEGSR